MFILNRKSAIENLKSLNDLVRPRKHLLRNRHADLLRRLEINHELKLRRLLHRKIGRLRALQDFVHVDGDAPVAVSAVGPVVHERAGIYSFSEGRREAINVSGATGSLAQSRRSVFDYHALAGPRAHRVHPGAAFPSQ